MEHRNTYEALANLLRWSFTALWEGRWPTHDHLGKPFEEGSLSYELAHGTGDLADGYFAVLWVIESDLDFLAVFWDFPRHTAAMPCAFCPCTNRHGGIPWYDFSLAPPAPWMTQFRDVQYMLDNHDLFPNAMYTIPGVTPMTVCIDWMHTKYLGTDQYFLGSVLWVLCNLLMDEGHNDTENCKHLWTKIKREYRARGTTSRYRMMKTNMFSSGSGGYPQLKGKAGCIHHLGPILRHIIQQRYNPDCAFQVAILEALKSSEELEEILSTYKDQFKFPPEFAVRFRDLCITHVKQQQELKDFSDYKIFNVTFKHHWLVHAGHRAQFQNPRMGWCFQGEDLMLKIREMTHPCTFGTKDEFVHKKLLSRNLRSIDEAFSRVCL